MIYLNTDHLQRCIETLRFSLVFYQRAEAGSVDQEVFRNAIVKGYELAQETAFKLLRKALKAFGHSSKTLNELPVKEVLRMAAVHGLMTVEQVERWFRYRDNRNNTAHDYGETFASETLVLIPDFLHDIAALVDVLKSRLGKEHGDA